MNAGSCLSAAFQAVKEFVADRELDHIVSPKSWDCFYTSESLFPNGSQITRHQSGPTPLGYQSVIPGLENG